MAHFIEHILRTTGHKLRAHSCHWAALPEVTVPSAAVSDDEVDHWSDLRYMTEIVDDFLAMARVTAANIACPIIERVLATGLIGDEYEVAS